LILTICIVVSLFLPWPWNVVLIVVGVVLEVGEVIWGRRLARRMRAKTGPEAMIGGTAQVVEPCRPRGRVRFHGELWDAVCEEGADIGESVRIVALEELTLRVEPARRGASGVG
jgi:membrane protein implicated in regulation of membrane protease activity